MCPHSPGVPALLSELYNVSRIEMIRSAMPLTSPSLSKGKSISHVGPEEIREIRIEVKQGTTQKSQIMRDNKSGPVVGWFAETRCYRHPTTDLFNKLLPAATFATRRSRAP